MVHPTTDDILESMNLVLKYTTEVATIFILILQTKSLKYTG